MKNEFKDKRILVIGGTGSIGSAIVRMLLEYDPKQIRIFSRDESKQFDLEQELEANSKLRFLVGDVRDKDRLNMAMEDIDIVFHAAALKHVSSCEKNPFEAVKTNVQGTQNVIDCAFANNVDKVIGISTDKAADPTNVMGCTKLLAERLMLSTYFYKGNKKTKFCFVRFGNVLGSRGSVVPLFIKQAQVGGPMTVSDPKMTRFFMTIEDAVLLVFKAAEIMKGREIFILKMPSMRIGDLAKAIVAAQQKKNESSTKKIAIKIIGKKDGERDHEKLLTSEEAKNSLENKDMFIILPPNFQESVKNEDWKYLGAHKTRIKKDYDSKTSKHLGIGQIQRILEKAHLL